MLQSVADRKGQGGIGIASDIGLDGEFPAPTDVSSEVKTMSTQPHEAICNFRSGMLSCRIREKVVASAVVVQIMKFEAAEIGKSAFGDAEPPASAGNKWGDKSYDLALAGVVGAVFVVE